MHRLYTSFFTMFSPVVQFKTGLSGLPVDAWKISQKRALIEAVHCKSARNPSQLFTVELPALKSVATCKTSGTPPVTIAIYFRKSV